MTTAGHPLASAAPARVRGGLLRRMSGFWLLIALLALVAAAKVIQADSLDPDAWWHLRVADQLVHNGVGPLVDTISFASEKTPWTPYSWLAELGMRAVWNVGGFRLATLVTAAMSAGIVVLTALATVWSPLPVLRGRVREGDDGAACERSQARGDTVDALETGEQFGACSPSLTLPRSTGRGDGNALSVALLVAVAAFFTLPFVSFRPVTLALLLLAAIVALLERDRRAMTRWVWLVVPLTVLMTNVHLYAVLVPAVIGLTAAGAWFDDRRRFPRYALLTALAAVSACCTPMLPGAVATALRYQAVDPMVAADYITEMRPFYSGGTGKVSLALFVGLMLTCVLRRRTLTVTDWLWLAMGTALLWRLGRFSPVFAILATPAFARAVPALSGRALERAAVKLTLAAVLLLGVANVLPALGERDLDRWLNRNAPTYPTDAAAYVATHVSPRSGHLINEFNWGGYLAWRLGDRWRVLMDGRTQLYAPAFWRQTHLGTPATRLALLRTIEADAAVLPADDSCLAGPLRELGWREAYRDGLAVVLVPGA